jgi:hypothetical protein
MDAIKEMKGLRDIQASRLAIAENGKHSDAAIRRERKLLADIEAKIAKLERQANAKRP